MAWPEDWRPCGCRKKKAGEDYVPHAWYCKDPEAWREWYLRQSIPLADRNTPEGLQRLSLLMHPPRPGQ